MEIFKNKLIVHGLIIIDEKYIVIKRSAIKRGKPNVFPKYWDIPGGLIILLKLTNHSDYADQLFRYP